MGVVMCLFHYNIEGRDRGKRSGRRGGADVAVVGWDVARRGQQQAG